MRDYTVLFTFGLILPVRYCVWPSLKENARSERCFLILNVLSLLQPAFTHIVMVTPSYVFCGKQLVAYKVPESTRVKNTDSSVEGDSG